jgi:radical SAM family uncharacterized protein
VTRGLHHHRNLIEYDILPRVARPARYTGGEWNMTRKDHDRVQVRVALAFPDVYEIGMSHLGLRILYDIVNQRADALAERVFSPWLDMEEAMRRHGVPLFSLESWTPVSEFDVLGISLQHELSYPGVLNLLDLAGLPLRASARDGRHPLVIAGGPCAFNPEPLAPFLDAVVLGEGEEALGDIITLLAARSHPADRQDLLRQLSQVPGVYVPSLYSVNYTPAGTVASVVPSGAHVPAVVSKRVLPALAAAPYPAAPIVPFLEIVHDRAMVEIFRGCTQGCRFCQAGMIYRPVRERPAAEVTALAGLLTASTGHDELSLVSLSSCDYSGIDQVIRQLLDTHGPAGVGISLPSLRVDSFSVDLAQQVQRVRKTGLTFAPEAGTQRLRNVINKRVTDEDLMRTAKAAFEAGWDALKLYFMIGLPTETQEDLLGIARLANAVVAEHRAARRDAPAAGRRRPVRVTVSLSTFVPKAMTPLQWEPQDAADVIRDKQAFLKRELPKGKIELDWHDPGASLIEGALARGDRRVADVLEAVWRLGARFEAWGDQFDAGRWERAFDAVGLDPTFYANRRRPYEETLPWGHLSCGVDESFLREEHRRALAGQATGDCRDQGCAACGVCPRLNVAPDIREAAGVRDAAGAPADPGVAAVFTAGGGGG